jgi:glycosyltransferase involved in cell wall biosynthesis
MKHLITITDTWLGMTNGVATVIAETKKVMEANGVKVSVIHPDLFFSVPTPGYPEIRLSFPKRKIEKLIRSKNPDFIHIATEGPMGLAARAICIKNRWKFTSAYHTRFPEYLEVRLKTSLIKKLTYKYLRWFHSKSQYLIVSTPSLKSELEAKGFKNIIVVPLGVDTELFKKNPLAKIPVGARSPIFVFLGRVAIEKNIAAFLKCELPGTKMIIGDGPQRKELEKEFKNQVIFTGYKKGQALVDLLSAADVFVFPSKTDTFGLTLVEAMACELPVAAYDVQGPRDIVTSGVDGFLGDELQANAIKCLDLDGAACRRKALQFSWENAGKEFMKYLVSTGSKNSN